MGNSVFILGAGASVHAGAPMMREFLDQAALVGRSGPGTEDREAFNLVSRARSELQLVHSKARFDLLNLESVFAAFEMAELSGRLGSMKADDVGRLTAAMRRVIVRTLEMSMRFQVMNSAVQASEAYRILAYVLESIADKGEQVSVITFNYDIGVDFALAARGFQPNYALPNYPASGPRAIDVLKLHGSLNWGACTNPKCGGIGVYPVYEFVEQLEKGWAQTGIPTNGKDLTLDVSRKLPTTEHLNCRHNYEPDPVVVPPTTNKAGYQKQLQPVWARAAKRLAEADSIYVIGYSWPLADQFFHHLFAVGSVSEQLLRRFCVINPDEAVRVRFRDELLGQQSLDRFEAPTVEDGGRFGYLILQRILRDYGTYEGFNTTQLMRVR